MIRFLPFILIPILILGGLGYLRYKTSQNNLTSPQKSESVEGQTGSIEVPKSLPQANLEDRVKALENLANKLVIEVNKLKSVNPKVSSTSSPASSLDASVTELKSRVSALEKATPVPQAFSQSTVYIPMGATSGLWSNSDWLTISDYQISLDPGSYPGYTGMNLEVIFRLIESSGVGSVRLINTTDNTVVSSSQVDTSSSTYVLQSSSLFKLATGTKTYKLQVKITGKEMYIQSARLRVSF